MLAEQTEIIRFRAELAACHDWVRHFAKSSGIRKSSTIVITRRAPVPLEPQDETYAKVLIRATGKEIVLTDELAKYQLRPYLRQ